MTAALLLLALLALWLVRRLTGRATPLRPAVERSNVRVIGRPGQPGQNEGERAGLVGRERLDFPSVAAPDWDRHIAEAIAVGDGRDLAARVEARRDDWRPTLILLDNENGSAS